MTAALEGGEWSAARPRRTLPPGKTRYPFYTRLGGPQGRSGRAENLVPTGIRSRTVQPVAQSLYRLSYPAHSSKYIWRTNPIHRLVPNTARFQLPDLHHLPESKAGAPHLFVSLFGSSPPPVSSVLFDMRCRLP